MKVLEFEQIARDKIVTFERGYRSETITTDMYDLYVEEGKSVPRHDIELIPTTYYLMMKRGQPIQEIAFDEHQWNTELEPKLPNRIQTSLLEFQKKAIYQMFKKKRCLNASEMGLGKTLQAISMIHINEIPTKSDLIICPGSLRTNWKNEFEKWAPDAKIHVITTIGSKEKEKELLKTFLYSKSIYITSYELASRLFGLLAPKARQRGYFNTIIVDESHYMKEPTSKRFTHLKPVMECANHLYLMSGTPSPNRPAELYNQLCLLDHDVFNDRKKFCDRYCNGYVDSYGRYNDRGCSKLLELSYLLSLYMIRLRKDMCLTDLPDITRTKLTIPCNIEKGSYFQKVKRAVDMLESSRSGLLELQQLVSQLFIETAFAKIEPVLEFVRNLTADEQSEKTILFCTHRCMYDAIENELQDGKVKFISICGMTPKETRQEKIDRFLKGDATFALLTLGTCSTGLTLTPVRNMVFTELHWCPSIIHQAECRINRIGGAKGLEYTYIIGENTLDEYIFSKLSQKSDIVNLIVDQNEINNIFQTF